MARNHGKRGRVYMGIAAAAEASLLPFIASWEVNHSTDKQETTAFGDANKQYANGMADAQGSFRGFLDDATAQTYTASIDGLSRKLYIYPDISSSTKYWYGLAVVDMTAGGAVDSAVTLSVSWNAASDFLRSW